MRFFAIHLLMVAVVFALSWSPLFILGFLSVHTGAMGGAL